MDLQSLKKSLNKEQLEAVLECEHPTFVLSGAGTGKTRVITHKIAFLTAHLGYRFNQILAMTFTNKAAAEMKERALDLMGEEYQPKRRDLWIGTFHSNCAKILRFHGKILGFTPNFTIIDEADRVRLLKELSKESNYKHLNKISKVKEDISRAKNNFLEPKDLASQAEHQADSYLLELSELFKAYNRRLYLANSMDFDDLIINVVKLLYKDSEIKAYWQKKFQYILVDEFQDTNKSQYLLLKLLMKENGTNLTMVGDDDQSIYSFRGASIENVQNLREDFDNLKIVRVTKNYRSVPEILNLANEAISFNQNRLGKELESTRDFNEQIPFFFIAQDDKEEAGFIASQIEQLYAEDPSRSFAVIYRTNAQSRIFEATLSEHQLPYKILGAKSFFDRKEIKDIISYFRLIVNRKDELAFKRVVNLPARGIGKVTLDKLQVLSNEKEISLFKAVELVIKGEVPLKISKKTLSGMKDFCLLINELDEYSKQDPVKTLSLLIDSIDYIKYMENYDNENARVENIEELKRFYESYFHEEEDPSFEGFLERFSLLDRSDVNKGNESLLNSANIYLTTVHACKGLEFDAVFVAGMCEELFPHYLTTGSLDELEEERRLFYVAVTRAKDFLFLSYPKKLFRNGGYEYFFKSRFVDEIKEDKIIKEESEGNSGSWDDLKDFDSFFSS